MKPIILILSCKRDTENGRNAAMRLALSDSKIPYKFFQAESTRFDEIAVDAPDNWESLAIKRQESLKWGLQHGYNEFFCVCVDTFIHTERLGAVVPTIFAPYIGNVSTQTITDDRCKLPFCHGGPGYWLSKEAALKVVRARFGREGWAWHDGLEDQFVGRVLYEQGIDAVHDPRYSMGTSYGCHQEPVLPANDIITCHLSNWTGVYNASWMQGAYRRCFPERYPSLSLAKPVILVSSCVRDRKNGSQQAIRDTWGADSKIPYFFFLGDTAPEAPDEVELDCPDNYFSLPQKTQLSLKWALDRGYTHMIRAFTDTYIDTQRLVETCYGRDDYVGNLCTQVGWTFINGGPGYILSRKCAKVVVDSDIGNWQLEDQWVGWLMSHNKIEPIHDPRFSMGRSYTHREPFPLPDNDVITAHLSSQRGVYDKYLMYRTHRRRVRLR